MTELETKSKIKKTIFVKQPASSARFVIEISDLIMYMSEHTEVSGIQRVQLCLVSEIINDYEINSSRNCIFIAGSDGLSNSVQLSKDWLATFIDICSSADNKREKLNKHLDVFPREGDSYSPRVSDAILIVGAFWVFPNSINTLRSYRSIGCAVGFILYDLIPITHPAFVDPPNAANFVSSLIPLIHYSDFVITISHHVATQFIDLLKRYKLPPVPVETVQLAHQLPPRPIGRETTVSSRVENLLEKPFVLSVGTIEVRKNHVYLLRMWEEWLRSSSPDEVPNLVIVGRTGWRVDDFFSQLISSDYCNHKISVIENATDFELDILYSKCLFSMFPSLYEGWGLPVGESLSRGAVCIASNTSSIPEVGGSYALYIDPLNVRDGLNLAVRLSKDRHLLKSHRDNLKNFKARSWRQAIGEIFSKIDRFSSLSRSPYATAGFHLVQGDYVQIRSDRKRDIEGYIRTVTKGSICNAGWSYLEEWGVWAISRKPSLKFAIDRYSGGSVTVVLKIRLISWAPNPCRIKAAWNGKIVGQDELYPNVNQFIRIKLPSDINGDGNVDLALELEGDVGRGPDKRLLHFSLMSIACYEDKNVEARMNFMENLLFSKDFVN